MYVCMYVDHGHQLEGRKSQRESTAARTGDDNAQVGAQDRTRGLQGGEGALDGLSRRTARTRP